MWVLQAEYLYFVLKKKSNVSIAKYYILHGGKLPAAEHQRLPKLMELDPHDFDSAFK